MRNAPAPGAHHEYVSSTSGGVELSSDRTFGLVFAAFFTVLWIVPVLRGRPMRWPALGLSLLCFVLAFAAPRALHSLNVLWAKLAILLHHVISPVAMALVFFLAFTPVGLLLRAFGKDLLRLRPSPDADTYWIPRDPPGPAPETMAQQF